MIKHSEKTGYRVHDLIRLTGAGATTLGEQAAEDGQDWVSPALQAVPWVVLRRSRTGDPAWLAVGVRGKSRRQRWAGEINLMDVAETVSPIDAASAPIHRPQLPAFRALNELREASLRLPWGPGGSIGFELATGAQAAHETSDLDLVVFADKPLAAETVNAIQQEVTEAAQRSGAAIDILVETPVGGVAFVELARAVPLASAPTVMLRTADGPDLVVDPWERR